METEMETEMELLHGSV